MRAAGVFVNVAPQKRPNAHVVVLDDGGVPPTGWPISSVRVVEAFAVIAPPVDIADILHALLTNIRGRLSGLNVAAVTVRRAEQPPVATKADGPKFRLLAEGVIIGAAREEVDQVSWRLGKQIATACGAPNAASVDAAAAGLPDISGAQQVAAAAAALASLIGDR